MSLSRTERKSPHTWFEPGVTMTEDFDSLFSWCSCEYKTYKEEEQQEEVN